MPNTHRNAPEHGRLFPDGFLPAPVGGGLSDADRWVWCGSVVRDDRGEHHMFASAWDRRLPFAPNWVTNSRVMHAVAPDAIGPYCIVGPAFPPREPGAWDARMTHNPTVHRHPDGRYLLFYTGTTYDGPTPTPESPEVSEALWFEARANQRIGLAVADDPAGPWQLMDRPVLEPRPGRWDALMTTNPAPVLHPDGSVLLAYKSTGHQRDLLRYGLARAPRPEGPYERVSDRPMFDFGEREHVEDACLWLERGVYHLVMKDMAGGIGGTRGGGVYATSPDAVNWIVADPPVAWTRTVRWDDGTTTEQGCLERPQVLLDGGRPTHAFFATADGPGGFRAASRTWNLVIPLRPSSQQ